MTNTRDNDGSMASFFFGVSYKTYMYKISVYVQHIVLIYSNCKKCEHISYTFYFLWGRVFLDVIFQIFIIKSPQKYIQSIFVFFFISKFCKSFEKYILISGVFLSPQYILQRKSGDSCANCISIRHICDISLTSSPFEKGRQTTLTQEIKIN